MSRKAAKNVSLSKGCTLAKGLRAAICLVPSLILGSAYADAPVVLTWTTPTQFTDDSPLTLGQLCCANVYRGTKADGSDLAWIAQVKPWGNTFSETRPPGVWCYAVAAITTVASDMSNVVCRTILAPTKAKAPSLTVTP